jgi:hypothetical protein
VGTVRETISPPRVSPLYRKRGILYNPKPLWPFTGIAEPLILKLTFTRKFDVVWNLWLEDLRDMNTNSLISHFTMSRSPLLIVLLHPLALVIILSFTSVFNTKLFFFKYL